MLIRITGKFALAFNFVRRAAFGRLRLEIGTLSTWLFKGTGRYDARAVLPPRPWVRRMRPGMARSWATLAVL